MEDGRDQFHVRRITADDPNHDLALRVVFDTQPSVTEAPTAQVADLHAGAPRHFKPLELLFGTYVNDRLVSACLALESPGAVALVYVPKDQETDLKAQATLVALRALRDEAWGRSIRLLEVLLEPGLPRPTRTLREAGFSHLTELLYLERHDRQARVSPGTDSDLTWVTYSSEATALFCEALDASYVQSLDCPELTGLRPTFDVLAGHQATGLFDPSLWWVVKRADTPAGVLLLNRVPAQPALEIVYLGVAQPMRGKGVADALLGRAVEAVRHVGAKYLTLAVDVRNAPALRAYDRWGFEQKAMRRAWIASSPRT